MSANEFSVARRLIDKNICIVQQWTARVDVGELSKCRIGSHVIHPSDTLTIVDLKKTLSRLDFP